MQKMKVCAVSLALSAATALPAAADWQYTRWGAPQKEVMLTPGQNILATSPKEQEDLSYGYGQALAKTTYSAVNTKFSVSFLFREDQLSGVVMYMDDRATAAHVGALLGDQYGKADEDTSEYDNLTNCTTESRSWRDVKAGNVIAFRSWFCPQAGGPQNHYIMYRPIVGATETGL
ncbi:hypothetical protein [Pararhizobium sp.]|uniref:hypothetical protein n=1 Tax=Pararhizobium sp. TaxID=1977563 RepID=UPI003D1010BD